MARKTRQVPEPQPKLTYETLMAMAKAYSVDQNPLFMSAARRYVDQVALLDKIRDELDTSGVVVTHTNVRGGQNVETHPLVAAVPKYVDACNRTLSAMLSVIQQLGIPGAKGNRLQSFVMGMDDDSEPGD